MDRRPPTDAEIETLARLVRGGEDTDWLVRALIRLFADEVPLLPECEDEPYDFLSQPS